jgi:hypothetical protein
MRKKQNIFSASSRANTRIEYDPLHPDRRSLRFLARQYTFYCGLASVRANFLLRAKVGACFVLVAAATVHEIKIIY